MAKKEAAVVEVGQKEIATGTIPDYLSKYVGDNRGNENVGVDDITLPRLEVVQSLSSARDESSQDYIEGAKEGMLYNSLTRQLYGQDVLFIPVMFRREYLLWHDLAKGGGFGGSFATEAESERVRATQSDPDNWETVLTHQHIGFLLDPKTKVAEEIVISMSRSKLKVSRRFNSLVRMVGANMPRFAKIYRVSGVKATNKQNQSYYNFSVDPLPTPHCWTPEALMPKIEAVYEMIQSEAFTIDRNYDTVDMGKLEQMTPGADDFEEI